MFRFICMILGYGIGCLQSAYLVGRFAGHVDLRQYGSGNLGTTNALRVLGKKAGTITFVCDILKSVLGFLLCKMIFQQIPLAGLYGCVGVILGHDFPFYLNFKGGKGIACMIGLVLCLSITTWYLPAFAFGIGIICIAATRYVSLGSMCFAVMIPIVLYKTAFPLEGVVITICLAALALYQHRANIVRLLSGNENKLGVKRVEKNV